MDSTFGKVFMFLTDLAWKSRLTIPIMVTTAFLVMDIRLQIEINIQSGQFNASDMEDGDDGDDQFGGHDHGSDDESGSDSYTDEEYNSEYTNDDGNNSETSHYSQDMYDPWGSEDEIDANYSREMQF
ncbi:protein PFC0760c [Drosophila biarmipes]|uniref:protein PFC0760c n=1 Tax=Drosophila biarmipes TaxID=125945 RepID=UPI0007E85489|nr:protein PFC0760c [Drosophila biarmipes]